MNGYRHNGERARIITILFTVLLATLVATIAGMLWQLIAEIIFANDPNNLNQISTIKQMSTANGFAGVMGYAFSIIFLFSIIFFIMWFRRAYYNLILLSPTSASYTNGWASGAWFVPFMNLTRPYRIMQELWHGIIKLLGGDSSRDYPSSLMGAWWFTWLLHIFINYFLVNFKFNDATLFSPIATKVAIIIGYILEVASLILIIIIVRKYAELEKRLEEALTLPQDSIFALNTNEAFYQTRKSTNENQTTSNE